MTVRVFKVGKVWHYRFQVGSKSVQRTTRETHKGRAQAIADAAHEDAKIAERGRRAAPTLRALVDMWIDTHKPKRSDAHVATVEVFGRLHLGELADLQVCDIDTEKVEEAHKQYLVDHALASANQWLKILKLLMKWAIRRKMLTHIPWHVPLEKLQKPVKAILPDSRVSEWLAEIDSAVDAQGVQTAVRLMLGMGLREMEAAGAEWNWIDWAACTYTPGKTKGKEAVALPMPAWLVDYLRTLPAYNDGRPEARLIAPDPRGAEYRPGYARAAITAANRACQIKGLTPHRLRGTYATMLSRLAPIQDVQVAMRHKSPLTTMGYFEKSMTTISEAQAAIAAKTGLGSRENCEHLPGEPHKPSLS